MRKISVFHGFEGRLRPTLTLGCLWRGARGGSTKAVLTPVIQASWGEKPIAEDAEEMEVRGEKIFFIPLRTSAFSASSAIGPSMEFAGFIGIQVGSGGLQASWNC